MYTADMYIRKKLNGLYVGTYIILIGISRKRVVRLIKFFSIIKVNTVKYSTILSRLAYTVN